jgi:starch synthase
MRCTFGYDNTLAHQIYAGADIFLMPSRYEPCGISQMISQRYGTIPIARATGGLVDTIINTTERKPGSGYLFEDLNATVFASKLTRAISDYQNHPLWTSMMDIAMKMDFSWEISAQKYIDEYQHLME